MPSMALLNSDELARSTPGDVTLGVVQQPVLRLPRLVLVFHHLQCHTFCSATRCILPPAAASPVTTAAVAGQKNATGQKKNRHSGQNKKRQTGQTKQTRGTKKTTLGQNKKLNSGQKKHHQCVVCVVVWFVVVLWWCCGGVVVVLWWCCVLLCCCFGCVGCVVCRVLCAVFCAFSPLSAGPPLRRTTLSVTAPPQDRFRRTPLCVSAVCVWSKICVLPRPSSPDRPLRRTPPPDPSAGPPLRRTAQNFALFFPPRHNFHSFFSLLGVLSLNFGGVLKAGALKCARLGSRAVV